MPRVGVNGLCWDPRLVPQVVGFRQAAVQIKGIENGALVPHPGPEASIAVGHAKCGNLINFDPP